MMLLAFTFYGILAGLACAATRKDIDLRWIGIWLVVNYAISNAMFFAGVPPTLRSGPYSLFEIMVMTAAFCSMGSHSRLPLIGLMCVSLVSIAANIALAGISYPDHRQIYLWDVTTNACFAIECLIAIGMGAAHEYRSGRLGRVLHPRGDVAQQGASFEDSGR